MAIALTDDHRSLAGTAADFLRKRGALAGARRALNEPASRLPDFWDDLSGLGWLGLHVSEARGGSGYGLEELVVVAEELGRACAPGPFSPTVIASATLEMAGHDDAASPWFPALATGTPAGIALESNVVVVDGRASGSAVVLSADVAAVLLVVSGQDVVVADRHAVGVTVETPSALDPGRPSSRVTFDETPVAVLHGAAQVMAAIARTVFSAEAAGVAAECTRRAAEYAKVRVQFGRPIATYQAVKHHCANMAVATEMTVSAAWDAARAAAKGGEQFLFAAAAAGALAGPAADLCANLSTQVHGGIAITWEDDAHLYLRRATVLRSLLQSQDAAAQLTGFVRSGVRRERNVDLPAEAEAIRASVRSVVAEVAGLDRQATREALLENGYLMPHWPAPYGRSAGAVEQLVVEQEFAAAGIQRPALGITGWVILTLIQHGTPDQVARWVPDALRQKVIWCQLFSEPDAGSDAAGITTKATPTDGGWLVNGQKVWTSGAHVAGMGFATVRTDPTKPKHQGITTMVIDMHADGVEVRPLKMTTGGSEFNEVFFHDVFVPADDVVGPVDGGWTVARATLGNESVSIGGGQGGLMFPADALIQAWDAHPERLAGGAERIGTYAATQHGMAMLNLRSVFRAVAGNEPGPEGAITKLVLSENGHDAAEMLALLDGPEVAFTDGLRAISSAQILMHRGISIAGGTSEIKRNQIGERILGLPRDPLIN